MSQLIGLSHSVSIMIYHFVCSAKYKRNVFETNVDEELKKICMKIENKYDMRFLEIGTDKNYVHY